MDVAYQRFYTDNCWVIAADKGYEEATRLGLKVDVAVGDFDSLSEPNLARLLGNEEQSTRVIKYPSDKNESDLELAIREAHRLGAQECVLLAAMGGRLDHTLFNVVAMLSLAHKLGIQAVIADSMCEIRLLASDSETLGQCTLDHKEGWLCSLLALDEQIQATEIGLRYNLNEATLYRASARGLSNVITSSCAEIRVKGCALLIISNPSIETALP